MLKNNEVYYGIDSGNFYQIKDINPDGSFTAIIVEQHYGFSPGYKGQEVTYGANEISLSHRSDYGEENLWI